MIVGSAFGMDEYEKRREKEKSLKQLENMAKKVGFKSYGEAYYRFTSANIGINPNAKNMESWFKQKKENNTGHLKDF